MMLAALLAVSAFAASPVVSPPLQRPLPRADARVALAGQASAFVSKAEATLEELGRRSRFSSWIQANFISYDTDKLAAEDSRLYSTEATKLAKQAKRFDGLPLPVDVKRKLLFLKLADPVPPSLDEQKELSELKVWLESAYARGKYCPTPEKCLTLDDMEDRFRESRDAQELFDLWKGWRTVSPPMRPKFQRMIELANKGARDLGFKDTAALWRAGYDMKPEEFSAELDRLWLQLKPLYDSLHAYVRRRVAEKYGKDQIGPDGLIPAHLLGNMWAQSWDNVYDLVAPPKSAPAYDLTERLKALKYDELKMIKAGEAFFTSLGLAPLPQTFWERSLITKPRDREVVCHASAWDVENSQDVRIKMCAKVTGEDFITVHHELGHNFYQRAYAGQPYMFRNSANDGFHEALGDTISLSVTPDYLKTIGLIDAVPGPEGDTDLLLRMALERVAFQPFGLLVDQWRWKVFSGEIQPERYNAAWWELVRKYQGIKPPVARGENDFDPGAKYHVAANVPYTRYFLAQVLQFQFYRALCRQHGHAGPLHRCSFYGDKEVGAKLNAMMALGASRPWPEALKAATGQSRMDATAILEYFAPLKAWLDEQNQGEPVGWKAD